MSFMYQIETYRYDKDLFFQVLFSVTYIIRNPKKIRDRKSKWMTTCQAKLFLNKNAIFQFSKHVTESFHLIFFSVLIYFWSYITSYAFQRYRNCFVFWIFIKKSGINIYFFFYEWFFHWMKNTSYFEYDDTENLFNWSINQITFIIASFFKVFRIW